MCRFLASNASANFSSDDNIVYEWLNSESSKIKQQIQQVKNSTLLTIMKSSINNDKPDDSLQFLSQFINSLNLDTTQKAELVKKLN